MDYDIWQVTNDIIDARGKLSTAKSVADFQEIGRGREGIVYRHKSATIKCHNPVLGMAYIKPESGIIAVGKGINCAPPIATGQVMLDDIKTQVSFSPFIDGIEMRHPDATDRILKLGKDGMEKFLNDYQKLDELGFLVDNATKNFIVTDNAINFIDLEKSKTQHPNGDPLIRAVDLFLFASGFRAKKDDPKISNILRNLSDALDDTLWSGKAIRYFTANT